MNQRICFPVLETNTIKYSVQPGTGFLDDGYYRATRQVHSGIDLNAVTGGDTDYGNRVRCCADGIVVSAGDYPSWGGIVLVHHPDLGVWTQYAHLINICVRAGQRVSMSTPLGQIGKGANNQFPSHLHFEVRRSLLPAQFWASARFPTKVGAEQYIREHYLDPKEWLEQHRALRRLAEVEAVQHTRPAPNHEEAKSTSPQSGGRILLSRAGQPFTDISGARVEIKDAKSVVVNATDTDKIQVRVD